MQLLIADQSVKKLVGIPYDVVMKVPSFVFPRDIVILDCNMEFEVPIVLCRSFIETRRVLVNIEVNELKFRINDQEVNFNIYKSTKQLKKMNVVSVIDVIQEDNLIVPVAEEILYDIIGKLVDPKGKSKKKKSESEEKKVVEKNRKKKERRQLKEARKKAHKID